MLWRTSFFSLPLLMAIRKSSTKATRHPDILGRMMEALKKQLEMRNPKMQRVTHDHKLILRNGQRSALLFGPLTKGPADQQVESPTLQV